MASLTSRERRQGEKDNLPNSKERRTAKKKKEVKIDTVGKSSFEETSD
jgi:hypothetical protein